MILVPLPRYLKLYFEHLYLQMCRFLSSTGWLMKLTVHISHQHCCPAHTAHCALPRHSPDCAYPQQCVLSITASQLRNYKCRRLWIVDFFFNWRKLYTFSLFFLKLLRVLNFCRVNYPQCQQTRCWPGQACMSVIVDHLKLYHWSLLIFFSVFICACACPWMWHSASGGQLVGIQSTGQALGQAPLLTEPFSGPVALSFWFWGLSVF